MADVLTPRQRSYNMSRIKSGNTKPELALRSALHEEGLRFRIHRKDLPGKPDIVFPSARLAIFIHGCFWHRHPGCIYATTPQSNAAFWIAKFKGNIERDKRNILELEKQGWRTLVVWECEIKVKLDDILKEILSITNR